jgi:putative ABC transport system substrate-binding protein
MRRRDLLQVLCASILLRATGTIAAPAAKRIYRIGWLEPRGITGDWRLTLGKLTELGWTRGVNLRVDFYSSMTPLELPRLAKELVSAQPDLIVSNGTLSTDAILAESRSIPVLFFGVTDPVGAGFVKSFSRPGGNATGFAAIEPSLGGKWLELLKEVDPRIRRAAILFNPDAAPDSGSPFVRTFEHSATSLSVQPIIGAVRNTSEIEALVSDLAATPDGALIVLPDPFTESYCHWLINLAARHRVPTIYGPSFAPDLGGLMSYGPDEVGVPRELAHYIDRVLRGERPADLPVQAPTRHELAINLRTARTLELTIPPTLLALADQLIE